MPTSTSLPASGEHFPRLKIAVSDCLRGTECRYNGGHAQDDFINQALAKYADFCRSVRKRRCWEHQERPFVW